MNIYIHIEWTKRELDSSLLMATLAADKGANIFLSDSDSFIFLLKKNLIKPGVFHTKSLVHDSRKQKFIENLKNKNFMITAVDEEGGFVPNDVKFFIGSRFTSEALNIVDKVFCWGKHDFEALNEKFKTFRDKFCLSGAPRVDLWKKKFDPYWENNLTNLKKKYVLIPSNFGIVNSNIAIWKTYYNYRKAGSFERDKLLENNFIERTSMSLKLFYKFVQAINFLTDQCKNINFVVRPHPLESMEVWKLLLNKRENLIIDNKEAINSVLINSLLVIQNGSTTAYEAVLHDIPVISYHPLKEEVVHGKPPNDLGMLVGNLDDLKSKVIDVYLKKINEKDYCKKEKAETQLNFNQEELSSSTIVDTWMSYLKNYKEKNNWIIIFLNLFLFQLIKKIIFNLLIFFKFQNDKKKILGETKFENKKKNYYQEKVNKLCKILNITSKIEVYKIINNTILIRKKREKNN